MQALTYRISPVGWATCKWLRYFWRGCVLSKLAGLEQRELEPPALPGNRWVRVRTRLGGICGTDLAILAQKQPPDSILQAFTSSPILLGHENVAVVEEVGPDVDRSWIGRRVCVEPTLCCSVCGIEPECSPCGRGEYGACENFGAAGIGSAHLPPGTSIGYNSRTGGSFGESFVAHVDHLVPVPDEMPDEQAVLTDPLACSLHAVLRAGIDERVRQVLVYGAGVLGLGVISALRATGFTGRIDALDRAGYLKPLAESFGAEGYLQLGSGPERYEEIARRTGATVQRVRFGNYMLSGGYDVIFDCVGSAGSISESLKWTAARGTVVCVGTGHGGRVDLTPLWFRELSLKGAYGRQREHLGGRRVDTYALVHELMLAGRLKTDGLLTHTFPLGEYRQAFTVAMNKGAHRAVKVAFDFRTMKTR
ncbi:MAG: alcohol dehydrogenase catalytic domain-containing protein [Planctomycetota bacterium]